MSALLGTEPVLGARVHVPGYGLPWIDVTLTEPATLAGEQSFEIGGVTIAATIVAGGPWQGRARYRLVGGKGGWGAPAPAKAYNDDAGVKVSKVAQDLAAACGETLGPLPTTRRGPHYARDSKAAYLTLHELAPRAWYVDFDGVTQFGTRAETSYTGDATIVRNDQAARVVELALDTIDPLLVPGVSVAGNPPASDVEYELGPSRLTCRVFWGAPKLSRRLDAYVQIFDALFPNMRFAGVFEYRVVTQEGERLNLQPVRTANGMPDLARVPVRPGVSGFRSDVTPGELVLVCFADRDPSRPQVFAHDHADSEGWLPSITEIGEATDFLATKTAIDTLQQRFDEFLGSEYDVHVHPTGVGPSGPHGAASATVGALPSTDVLKASKT